jgi:cytochrome c oxidase subunit 2
MFNVLLLAATIAGATGAPAAPPAAIDVVASNWAFTPGTVTLHVGTAATFHFTSKEGVHGVSSDGLGIPSTMIVPGKTATVVVTPKKTGSFKVQCSVPCGPGHATMTFTVVVEP